LLLGWHLFDRIEQWLLNGCQGLGVEVGGPLLRLLLYADDLALLACSKHQLQAFCAYWQTFVMHLTWK